MPEQAEQQIEPCPFCGGACSLCNVCDYAVYCDSDECKYLANVVQSATEAIAAHNTFCRQVEIGRRMEALADYKYCDVALHRDQWQVGFFSEIAGCCKEEYCPPQATLLEALREAHVGDPPDD